MKKGLFYAFLAAIISGFSVYYNSLAVKALPNAYFFTTAKNALVAVFIIGALVAANKHKDIFKLSKKDWGKLLFVGLIGGSIPFLLFFQGLSLVSPIVTGAFIQKSMFVFVALIAYFSLKEKLSLLQYLAILVILFGVYLAGGVRVFTFGTGEILIFLATGLWAVEAVFVKKYLSHLDSLVAASGRMIFGSLTMLLFLITTNQHKAVFSLSPIQIDWILVTALFLFAYVYFYYSALKYEKAVIVTSVLTIAFPITVFLTSYHKNIIPSQYPSLIIVTGVALFVLTPKILKIGHAIVQKD